jgi:hypothetical protein
VGYNPGYKWINPTYPIYNWGYNPLTKWDGPPSRVFHGFPDSHWYAMVCPPEVSARSSALLHEVGHFLLRGIQTNSEFDGEKDAIFFHQISLTIQVRQWIFYEVILKFKHPQGPP